MDEFDAWYEAGMTEQEAMEIVNRTDARRTRLPDHDPERQPETYRRTSAWQSPQVLMHDRIRAEPRTYHTRRIPGAP